MRYLIILALIIIGSCNKKLIVSGENANTLILRTADIKVFVINKKDKKYIDYRKYNSEWFTLRTLDTVLYSFSKHRIIAVRRQSYICPNTRVWVLLNYIPLDTVFKKSCQCK